MSFSHFEPIPFANLVSFIMQLALSPSPRSPSEPISVTLDTQFVLEVEGAIERSQKLGQSIVRSVNTIFYDSIIV